MKLAVISHKVCRISEASPSGFATDGGFPRQMEAISELFDETRIVVPVKTTDSYAGLTSIVGKNLAVSKLSEPLGKDLFRKLLMPWWLVANSGTIWREIRQADAVHAPIPGDIGTIGLIFALVQRKPLFVRHCGNWLVQRTMAERIWKWMMERFAGGRNVMMATGGGEGGPSIKNQNIKWIFSTSLRRRELENSQPRYLPSDNRIRIIIACRQEKGKGTEKIIESLPAVRETFPKALLDVVGDGAFLDELKEIADRLGLTDCVKFHGRVAQSEVVKLMKRAHIFCFPTESEGFPKVVLEAFSCGLPVITTKVSVLPQLISRGGGILIENSNPPEIARAIVSILKNAEHYERMSALAIETARAYSLESWRDEIGENLRNAWKTPELASAVQ
ncbi:MAG: glycosyltransferase family 4 protein [Pyrinomonadaceae bacterium]|nr:glycosyltransferase family 4 protein [Pyrinomonadaceae bacterium]